MSGLESLSLTFFWSGLICVAISALFYVAAAWGWRVVVRQAATSAGTMTISEREPLPPTVGRIATVFSWFSLGLLLTYMVTRSIATGHPPYSNMFEYLSAFGTITIAAHVVFERRYHQRALGAFAMPLALLILLLAQQLFSPNIHPLVPALQNNRLLAIHVACMVISYGVLTVAFAAAVMYLIQTDANKYARLPKAKQLERIGYRSVLIGFPLLGLGIALGAYWGNIAWGRYWGWDPKETTALVTWLVFAGYLHARSLGGWRGKRAAFLIIAGWAIITFNIFAVNFVFAGLHSYAGA
ncbi:MAG: c-type cytochrome biogenesis protein CcsB [Dehalococcoidia bacterium]